VSKRGDNGGPPEKQAFDALERAVDELLGHLEALDDRLSASESRSAELGEVVQRFTGEEGEAERILTRLSALEEENSDLRGRLEQGREGVDRLLAKIRFLENQE
jgi:predicted RNase H-like nuclease (RuvC/YqgF family)